MYRLNGSQDMLYGGKCKASRSSLYVRCLRPECAQGVFSPISALWYLHVFRAVLSYRHQPFDTVFVLTQIPPTCPPYCFTYPGAYISFFYVGVCTLSLHVTTALLKHTNQQCSHAPRLYCLLLLFYTFLASLPR